MDKIKVFKIKRKKWLGKKTDCPECNMKILVRNLKSHISNAHRDRKAHICTICEKSYKSKGALTVHVVAKHSEDPPEFKCSKCSSTFVSENGLQRHFETVKCHAQERNLFRKRCSKCGEMFKMQKLYLQHNCMTRKRRGRGDHSKEKEDVHEKCDVTLEKLSNGNILISLKYLEEGELAHLKDLKTSYFGGSKNADPVTFPVIKTCKVIGVPQLIFSNGFNNNITLNQLMCLPAGLPVAPDVVEVYFRDLFALSKPFVYISYKNPPAEDKVKVSLGKWLVSMRYFVEKKHIYMTVFKVSKDGRKVDVYFLDPQNEHWDKIKLEGRTSTFYEEKVEDALKVLKGLQWETEEPSVIEFVSCKVQQCKDFEDDGMTCISYCVNYMRNFFNLVHQRRRFDMEGVIKKIPELEDEKIGAVKREVFDFVLAKSRNEKVQEFKNVLNSLKC